jgi:hypothetical protein
MAEKFKAQSSKLKVLRRKGGSAVGGKDQSPVFLSLDVVDVVVLRSLHSVNSQVSQIIWISEANRRDPCP